VTFIWNEGDAANIKSNDLYDVVSHEYDSFTFAQILHTMALRTPFVLEPYTEALSPTSTIALQNYIDDFMPCFVPSTQLPVILAYLVGSILGLTVLMSAVVMWNRRRESRTYGGRESRTETDSDLLSSLGQVVGGQQNTDFEPDYVEFSPDVKT